MFNIFDFLLSWKDTSRMTALTDLGIAIRERRSDMGLTQHHVAKLSGLSRTTINQVENGTIRDLSLGRATRLVDVLGLKMGVASARKSLNSTSQVTAIQNACRIANVSYKKTLDPESLKKVLISGEIPAEFQPHVRAVLEEAPVSLLASVAEQMCVERQVDRTAVWLRMKTMARALQSYREVWQ